MALQSSIILNIAKDDNPGYTFLLEEHKGGNDITRGTFSYVDTPITGNPFDGYVTGEPVVIHVLSGITNVRLYSPIEASSVLVYGTGGGSIKYIGMREDIIREVITFAGASQQTLSKGYGIVTEQPTILDVSLFHDENGEEISPPKYKGLGLFDAGIDAYGALAVEYSISFYLYQVEYFIPDEIILETQKVYDETHIIKPLAEYAILPITVLAFAEGGFGSTLSISRDFMTVNSATSPPEEPDCAGTWDEFSRKTKTIKVEDPDDSEIYINVEKIYEMTEICSSSGEKRVKRFNV